MVGSDGMRGIARSFVDSLNREIIAHRAVTRQGGRGAGDRPPPSLASPPVDLINIRRRLAAGRTEAITEPGQATARRRSSRIISRLDPSDPRYLAALRYQDAVERLGAVRGAKLEGASGGARSNDGGVILRMDDAQLLHVIEGIANRWFFNETRQRFRKARALVVHPVKPGSRFKPIKAMTLLRAVCIDGKSIADILAEHGYKTTGGKASKPLTDFVLETLAEIAKHADIRTTPIRVRNVSR